MWGLLWSVPVIAIAAAGLAPADAVTPEQREFFETRIRPVLAQDCYECHNSKDKSKGGLILDHREALMEGGDSGAVVVPGDPDASLLMQAIRHEDEDLKMPKAGAKLEDEVVANFVQWIAMGAPDPRDGPPSDAEIAADTEWEAVRERRKQWWSFQPVTRPEPPAVRDKKWSDHPVDRFILARLEEKALEPAKRADRRTTLRRLHFVLTGLPPTIGEIEAFLGDESGDAYARAVDRLLASPQFGERWARHWMDWMRYAESHGSEGDPRIPNMWRYRDYLIRALNADVTYDQLVREHLAGDLLAQPRVNSEIGINESAIGAAQYRLVQYGYAPLDALEEQVRFTENQIDVLSKAFLGLTVSCARCHDHKFDPISQKDFYAWYGIMASCRPATITVDTPECLETGRDALAALKPRIKRALADAWIASLDDLPARMASLPAPAEPAIRKARRNPKAPESKKEIGPGQAAVDEAADSGGRKPLHAWTRLRGLEGESFSREWKTLSEHWKSAAQAAAARDEGLRRGGWDLRGSDYDEWFPYGNGLPAVPSRAGEFHILPEGDRVIAGVLPAGVYTHLLSDKHSGVLTSPSFEVDGNQLSLRVMGDRNARVRLVLENYPRVAAGIYNKLSKVLTSSAPEWVHWSTHYWRGTKGHIELATSDDIPVESKKSDGRSSFGIVEVVFPESEGARPIDAGAPLFALLPRGAEAAGDASQVAVQYREALRACLEAWREDSMSDVQAEFLGAFVKAGLLPNTLSELPGLAPLVAQYRGHEAGVPVPTRVPGVLETVAFNTHLFERGDHKQPGEEVPRRFLELIDTSPYQTAQSGRLELAEDLLRPDNPLTARIIVNRIWHYVFGRGICETVDNFGRMGEKPTHPELLDYLAVRFVEGGWSMKDLIRELVLTETFRIESTPSPRALEIDPANELLSHARVRRLEAEAIRDAMLTASGELDPEMFGPGFAANGGAGQSRRRSVYLTIIRNKLDEFQRVFDAPEPFSTKGRRNITNVPGQSLTMMNDPFVIAQAQQLAAAILAADSLVSDEHKIGRMFEQALGRPPSTKEAERSMRFLEGRKEDPDLEGAWQDLAHAIFNFKEFIYIR